MSNQARTLHTVHEAYQLLQELGAPPKLILHVSLVAEAVELLISKLQQLGVQFDARFIRLGVAFHDAGKILHPEELSNSGNRHEDDGETLLISHGIDPKLARCCPSHAQWSRMDCSVEELCIALADTLWKGKRNAHLEELVVDILATLTNKDYWELFVEMDSCFETIASEGDSRLLRSQGA